MRRVNHLRRPRDRRNTIVPALEPTTNRPGKWIASAVALATAVGVGIAPSGGPVHGDAPLRPEELGPYAVGYEIVENATLSTGDQLVGIWYPADRSRTGQLPAGERADYGTSVRNFFTGEMVPLDTGIVPGWDSLNTSEIATVGVRAADDGDFPVLVYSGGSGDTRDLNYRFFEHLASHGFVVAAGTLEDPFDGLTCAQRFSDVRTIGQAVLQVSRSGGPDGRLRGFADDERIGVIGASVGGPDGLNVAVGSPIAEYFGIDPSPLPDVDAALLLEPAIGEFGAPPFASCPSNLNATSDLPVMAIGGSQWGDSVNTLGYTALSNLFADLPAADRTWVAMRNLSHFSVTTGVCDVTEAAFRLSAAIGPDPTPAQVPVKEAADSTALVLTFLDVIAGFQPGTRLYCDAADYPLTSAQCDSPIIPGATCNLDPKLIASSVADRLIFGYSVAYFKTYVTGDSRSGTYLGKKSKFDVGDTNSDGELDAIVHRSTARR